MKQLITKIVKNRIAESEYLGEFKGLKLESVRPYEEKGAVTETYFNCEKGYMMRLLATFSYKPAKEEINNRVQFQINVYSDGSMGAYFEGTHYSKA